MFDPDNEVRLFDDVWLPFSHDDESDAGSEADVYDLTINDIIFEEEDEDMDESFKPAEVDETAETREWEVVPEEYQHPDMSKPALRSRPSNQTLPSKAAEANAAPVIQAEAEAAASRAGHWRPREQDAAVPRGVLQFRGGHTLPPNQLLISPRLLMKTTAPDDLPPLVGGEGGGGGGGEGVVEGVVLRDD